MWHNELLLTAGVPRVPSDKNVQEKHEWGGGDAEKNSGF